jgi:hypothetical protein
MRTKTISSGRIFKTLIDLGAKPGTSGGKKVNAGEVRAALDAFKWGDGRITETEVIAARKEFGALQKAGRVTPDGARAFDEWFSATGAGEPGGFSSERSASAFEALEGFLRFDPNSQKGTSFTKAEAESLVSILGDEPAPARVADVMELRARLRSSRRSREAQGVLTRWLGAHPISGPPNPLSSALASPLAGLLWPSETDRPVYAVDLGIAPRLTQDPREAVRRALGERSDVRVDISSFDATFDRLTTVEDAGDSVAEQRAAKFAAVRDALKAHLVDLQLFKVGEVAIDVYALGRDANGRWAGVMSGVVET